MYNPTDKASVAMLPCPFCGKQPETQESGEGGRGLMIGCITPNCVNPHVSYYNHASARAVWNRRAVSSVVAKAKELIGAKNDTLSEAQKSANINQAWHVLDFALSPAQGDGMRDALAIAVQELRDEQRNAIIEECAQIIETTQETISESPKGSKRHLTPRTHNNLMGLAFAEGIRNLKRASQRQ